MAYTSYNRTLLGRATDQKLLLSSPPQMSVAELNHLPISPFMRSLSFLNQVSKIPGGAATCSKGFVHFFLRVPQAVGLYCSCHAAQASKGNFYKTFYKTFEASGRPIQYAELPINALENLGLVSFHRLCKVCLVFVLNVDLIAGPAMLAYFLPSYAYASFVK